MREDLEELEKLATPLDSASPANAHRNKMREREKQRGGEASVPEITCTLLLLEPLTYRDSRSADISWLISRRDREREAEKKKRLMQLRGKFHPLLGKVRRIGIRKLKSRRSQCYRYQSSGLRSVTRLVLETCKLSTFYVKR